MTRYAAGSVPAAIACGVICPTIEGVRTPVTEMRKRGCILFDWGNTLMRELPGFDGPMVDWPRVEAMPFAAEILATLRPMWRLAVATNAVASDDAQISAALLRAGLPPFDQIYCFRTIGHKKPAAEFFRYILADLRMRPAEVFMAGDDFEADVMGATRVGMRAIWLNAGSGEARTGRLFRTIHSLSELPRALAELEAGDEKLSGGVMLS